MLTLDYAMEGCAGVDTAYRDYIREYARAWYHKNKDRTRKARKESYERWRAAQTPEEREAFLAQQRELRRTRNKIKTMYSKREGKNGKD